MGSDLACNRQPWGSICVSTSRVGACHRLPTAEWLAPAIEHDPVEEGVAELAEAQELDLQRHLRPVRVATGQRQPEPFSNGYAEAVAERE